MKISLIENDRVLETKGGNLSFVDHEAEFTTLQEFANLALEWHIAPGIFEGGRKNQKSLESIQFLSFDFDEGKVSYKEVSERICNYNHTILASKNHMKDKGDGKGKIERFHLFMPLDKPIKSVEFFKWMSKYIAKTFKFPADRNCMEPARYFFRHSAELVVVKNQSNICVEWMNYLMKQEEYYDSVGGLPKRKLGDDSQFKLTKYYSMLKTGLKEDGKRYYKSCRIIGAMIACGMNEEDMLAMFDEHAVWGDSFTRKSVERRIRGWMNKKNIKIDEINTIS